MSIHLTLDYEALNRTIGGIKLLRKFDATPLMVAWEKIVLDDNRRKVLQGLDKDGRPMPPVKYRPVGKVRRLTSSQRLGVSGRARGKFGGFGPTAAGLHNNLSPEEYRHLDGPPLAPRRQYSRVITNFMVDHAKLPSGNWQVTYWWQDVVSVRGVSFLIAHFEGRAVGRGHKVRLPVRDLRGVTPEGQARITRATEAWTRDMLRSAFDPAAPYVVLPPVV